MLDIPLNHLRIEIDDNSKELLLENAFLRKKVSDYIKRICNTLESIDPYLGDDVEEILIDAFAPQKRVPRLYKKMTGKMWVSLISQTVSALKDVGLPITKAAIAGLLGLDERRFNVVMINYGKLIELGVTDPEEWIKKCLLR